MHGTIVVRNTRCNTQTPTHTPSHSCILAEPTARYYFGATLYHTPLQNDQSLFSFWFSFTNANKFIKCASVNIKDLRFSSILVHEM